MDASFDHHSPLREIVPGRFTRVSVQTPAGEIEARLSERGNWELRVRRDQETNWRLACTGDLDCGIVTAQPVAAVQEEVIMFGALMVDPAGRRVTVAGKEVALARKEFALLLVLAAQPDRVFSKEGLLATVWGHNGTTHTRTLDSHARARTGGLRSGQGDQAAGERCQAPRPGCDPRRVREVDRGHLRDDPGRKEEGKTRDRDAARKDALPFALAGYGSARHQEIQISDWEHLNLDVGGGELAGDEAGRKPGGSWRVIFFVKPLWEMLREEWEAQGRPTSGKVCPPKAQRKSGLLALNTLQARIHKRWEEQGLTPIGLHESRHTTATWLDHAGVSPKVISEFVGHKTPEYQLGPARITLQVYTHRLPGELERARVLFDKFLVERAADDPVPASAFAR